MRSESGRAGTDSTGKILESGALVLGVVALHSLFGMAAGYGIARAFKLNYAKVTAVVIEVGMQNSGLAVSLAATNFAANPLATLPGAIFSVWHNIAGSVFASFRSGRAAKMMEAAGSAASTDTATPQASTL